MKIAQSTLQLTSSHTAIEFSHSQESLTLWQKNKQPVRAEGNPHRPQQLKHQAEKLAKEAAKISLSAEAKHKAAEAAVSAPVEAPEEPADTVTDLNLRILKALFEKLTGRKMRLFDFAPTVEPAQAEQSAQPAQEAAAAAGEQQAPQGWGLVYEYHQQYSETETTRFSAQGVVQTADGQQIEIAIELNMSRSFQSSLDESLRMGEARLKDPLVLNFGGSAAQLTQDTFRFDIDADGSEDQIAFVAQGSGLLALDRNSDGTVNDGSELFGALSGDGFADLAAYDGDSNGWIDENDEVYSRLRIWSRTAAGEDQLLALGQRGVGALYLGRVATPFSLKDSSNVLQGQVQATGLYLNEQGGAGTLQQLDLVA